MEVSRTDRTDPRGHRTSNRRLDFDGDSGNGKNGGEKEMLSKNCQVS